MSQARKVASAANANAQPTALITSLSSKGGASRTSQPRRSGAGSSVIPLNDGAWRPIPTATAAQMIVAPASSNQATASGAAAMRSGSPLMRATICPRSIATGIKDVESGNNPTPGLVQAG